MEFCIKTGLSGDTSPDIIACYLQKKQPLYKSFPSAPRIKTLSSMETEFSKMFSGSAATKLAEQGVK